MKYCVLADLYNPVVKAVNLDKSEALKLVDELNKGKSGVAGYISHQEYKRMYGKEPKVGKVHESKLGNFLKGNI